MLEKELQNYSTGALGRVAKSCKTVPRQKRAAVRGSGSSFRFIYLQAEQVLSAASLTGPLQRPPDP
jgi:gluconate kinase